MVTAYIGNSKFCWEDAVAMMFSHIGTKISTTYLAAISGCGLGAFYDQRTNWLYFNFAIPNEELTYNLKKLGYEVKEVLIPKTEKIPMESLKEDLKTSPAVVGPIDMGLLRYNPNYKFLSGSDHFIVVYRSNDKGLFINDPAGFPCVFMSYKDFEKCWASKNISYGSEHYRYWTRPVKVSSPTEKEIYVQTIKDFQSIYSNCDRKTKEKSWITGSDAIVKTAERFENNTFKMDEVEHLIYFSFQLSAHMAICLGDFFKSYNTDVAEIKYNQAELFGLAQSFAMGKSWKQLAKTLRKISELEGAFKEKVFEPEILIV